MLELNPIKFKLPFQVSFMVRNLEAIVTMRGQRHFALSILDYHTLKVMRHTMNPIPGLFLTAAVTRYMLTGSTMLFLLLNFASPWST